METRDGIARKTIPHITPEMKELMLQRAITKHMPTPKLVNVNMEPAIALVDGKATLLMRL